jgi:hypothetical protein
VNNILLSILPDSIRIKAIWLENLTGARQYAWDYDSILEIAKYLVENDYMILGGDVIRERNGHYEYEATSWYFNGESSFSLKDNIELSYKKTLECLKWYNDEFKNRYLFVIIFEHVKVTDEIRENFRTKALINGFTYLYRLHDALDIIETCRILNKKITGLSIFDLSEGIQSIWKRKHIQGFLNKNDISGLQDKYNSNDIWTVIEQFIEDQQQTSEFELVFEISYEE